MPGADVERGRLVYTGRALQQDAREALGADVVRGLIELITNADDSYALGKDVGVGKIWIGVEHARLGDSWRAVVRDRAGGMSRSDMVEKLVHIGARTSGFEDGKAVRGNRGRGAKDLVVFGEVVFESIKDGRYCSLRLLPSGDYEISKRDHQALPEERNRLGINRGNGTMVTVSCTRAVRQRRHETLKDILGCDFQLRDIMSDPKREVSLAKLNQDDFKPEHLHYAIDRSAMEILLDGSLEIPQYPDARATLRVVRLPQRCDSGPSDATRACGLLLKGRRAIYDNTLFRFEGLPHAGWIAGRVECPYIDTLENDYDDREQSGKPFLESNPVPIISRRRRGLSLDHPFTTALAEAAEKALTPVVELMEREERDKAGRKESAEMRRALDQLGREAAKLMQQSLRELEEEDDPEVTAGALAAIAIAPPVMNIVLGDLRTLSVVCDRAGLTGDEQVVLEADPIGVMEFTEGLVLPLQPHRNRRDALCARIRLRALREGETIVTASVADRSFAALVRGVPKPPSPPLPPVPETLQFDRSRYSIGLGKRKTLEVAAPVQMVEQNGDVVKLTSNHEGVLVLRPYASLIFDSTLRAYAATARVEGKALGAKARIRASLGTTSTECQVNVVEHDQGLPDLRIELSFEDPGPFRAYFDPPDPRPDGTQTLWVVVRHPALIRILGEDLAGEDTNEWKVILAEVIADAMVRRLMTRRYPVSQEIDAQSLYLDHVEWQTKILPKVQKVLLSGPSPLG